MLHKIYMLTDPTGAETCYVGRTTQARIARLMAHVTDPCSKKMRNWIKALKVRNLIPTMTILDLVIERDAAQAEEDCIAIIKAIRGEHCLNTITCGRPVRGTQLVVSKV